MKEDQTNKTNGIADPGDETEIQYRRISGRIFVVGSLATGLVIVAYVSNFIDGSISARPAEWGVAGDFFGGLLNPLIAFLALYALLKIIVLEARALDTAKKEFSKSSAAFEEQNRNDRFFKLLDLTTRAREELSKATEAPGNRKLLGRLESHMTRYSQGDFATPEELAAASQYLVVNLTQFDEYRSFVRLFYTTFKLIVRSNMSENDENFYLDALLAVIKSSHAFSVAVWYLCIAENDNVFPDNWEVFDRFMKNALEGQHLDMYVELRTRLEGHFEKTN